MPTKLSKSDLLDLIDETKSILMSQATGGPKDNKEYKRCRDSIINIPELKQYVPRFLKSNRTSEDFFRYMQNESGTYGGRRSIINNEMGDLTSFVEDHYSDDQFSTMKYFSRGEELGHGGFGAVYRYHHKILDMDFAVKIFDPVFADNDQQREGEKRFFREAKIMFALENEHIVRIYDAGRLDDGNPYIRMELIEGLDLYQFHDEFGLLNFKTVAQMADQILDGLQCAHMHGIIHRDLKPSKVIVSMQNPEKWRCKIIDFGIGAFLDTKDHTKLTKTGERVAGGSFIDPILQDKPKLRDVRTDIYSVGAIMYYLLTGESPKGSGMMKALQQLKPELNQDQLTIIRKCLSANLDDRYSTCEDMRFVLKAYV